MATIQGLTKLVNTLRDRAAKSVRDDNVVVIVGFTAEYAIFVHENLTAYHHVGQAKFLEQPARQVTGEITRRALAQGRTLGQSLLLEGLQLQREAMILCPVDTGNLRASGFTKFEVGVGT